MISLNVITACRTNKAQVTAILPETEVENALLCRETPLKPEKRLMLAVLEDTVACFQKYVLAQDPRGKSLLREAEEWILEEDSDWLFCFENICETLGLDREYLREGLLRWKQRTLAERPKTKLYLLVPGGHSFRVSQTDSHRA